MTLDPTRNGMPLQAVISFSAFRVLPPRSAQLQRWASLRHPLLPQMK